MLTIIAVYVDDLIILGKNISEMERLRDILKLQFKIKDVGKLGYITKWEFASFRISKTKKCPSSREVHPKNLRKFGQIEAKPVSTPADLKDDGISRPVDAISYQSIAGSLLHAAIATRPDIALALGVVSKFCANPTRNHLTAAKRILRYLKGTVSLGLSFKKCADGNLTGYSDVDWAGDVDERHSTSGNPFSLARGAVSWLSKTQAYVSLSTAEADSLFMKFSFIRKTSLQNQ